MRCLHFGNDPNLNATQTTAWWIISSEVTGLILFVGFTYGHKFIPIFSEFVEFRICLMDQFIHIYNDEISKKKIINHCIVCYFLSHVLYWKKDRTNILRLELHHFVSSIHASMFIKQNSLLRRTVLFFSENTVYIFVSDIEIPRKSSNFPLSNYVLNESKENLTIKKNLSLKQSKFVKFLSMWISERNYAFRYDCN